MSIWKRISDGLENWGNKHKETLEKNMLATLGAMTVPAGYPEHDGWRKEVRQNIANREIDQQASNFLDQLGKSQKHIKPPERESKDREIER